MAKERLSNVDLLRGLVMALMALDHTRDFFSNALSFDPSDPVKSNGPLYLTRWVSHFCAPVFVLLAGVGAALAEYRGLAKRELSLFLLTRGLWLIVLEFTLVRLGFFFTLDFHDLQMLVIWTLGISMVLLAALIHLPRPLLLVFALGMIVGHHFLTSIHADDFGWFRWLWILLYEHGTIPLGGGVTLYPPYKIIPWVGVMALGYSLGPLFQMERSRRRETFFSIGLACVAAFFTLRFLNVYGDPQPWINYADYGQRMRSFFNCCKYPPSLAYLLMTLGPAFLMLAACDREPGWLGRRLIVFGRVPLFFYLLHLPLIHGGAVLVDYLQNGQVDPWLLSPPSMPPEQFGYSLPWVYAAWAAVLLILYPFCVGFGALKRKYPGGVLSYF